MNSSFAQNGYYISNFEKHKYIPFNPNFTTDSSIDIRYYKLNLEIKLNPNSIIGNVQINGFLKNDSVNTIYLNFSNNLTIDSIKSGNANIIFLHTSDEILLQKNNIPIQSNLFSLNVFYHGIPVPTGYGSFVFSSYNSTPSIWSLSEPFGASDWFPCKNSPDDKADSSRVLITCPSNLFGVSNGILESITINSNNTKTYNWKNSFPIANYLISVAITDYSIKTDYFKYSTLDSMPVNYYIYSGLLDSLTPLLNKTPNMLKIFSDRYGLYPFVNEKYGIAQFGESGGMEHQTVSSIGVFTEYVLAHELAHQWFGDKITCKDWHHIWLNEGFASYSECIYAKEVLGDTEYKSLVNIKMNDAKKAVGTIYVQDVNSISEIFNGFRSYAKGAMVLHMLRGITGDSVFFNILRNYLSDTTLAFKNAVTEDFKHASETTSGLQLAFFFNEWIYGENYPVYTINWNSQDLNNNNYKIFVNISQKQNTNPLYFTMPVDIKINTSVNDTTVTLFNNSINQTFEFIVKGKPVLITFDPDNKILKEKKGDEPVEIVGYNLSQNYPNPFNPNTTINYEIPHNINITIILYDILGKKVAVLVNQKQKAGKYSLKFSSVNFASGVYFYKISAGDFTDVKKMVIIH